MHLMIYFIVLFFVPAFAAPIPVGPPHNFVIDRIPKVGDILAALPTEEEIKKVGCYLHLRR